MEFISHPKCFFLFKELTKNQSEDCYMAASRLEFTGTNTLSLTDII